jgi:O-antigen/teichoic acid export membrane protein
VEPAIGARGWRADAGMLADCWRFAVRAYIATLLPYVVSRMNVFMIEQWAGKAELGFYSIAAQFFDAFMILPASIAMLLFPRIIRKQGPGRLAQTAHLALLVAGVMIAGSLALGLLAPWVIPGLFGRDFDPAVPAVYWMLPALIAFSVVNVVSQYLAAEGIPARKLWAWTASIPVMLVTGMLLIPTFGAAGGAMALSVTYSLLAIAVVAIAVAQSTRKDSPVTGQPVS